MLRTSLKILLPTVTIAICVFVGWNALNWGLADRNAHQAARLMKQWRTGETANAATLAEAIRLTRLAVSQAGDNPDYRDQLATLLTRPFLLERSPELGLEAKQHLLHSRQIRPCWGKNWATYVELKHYLKEVDDDLFKAIEQATRCGPFEPAVLQSVTLVGVAHFGDLPSVTQQAVITNIGRGLDSLTGGLPSRTLKLTEQGYASWTLPFTERLIHLLAEKNWQPRSFTAKTRLALRLWPLMTQAQKHLIIPRMAAAVASSRNNRLLNLIRAEGKLAIICPYLPRNKTQRRYCGKF